MNEKIKAFLTLFNSTVIDVIQLKDRLNVRNVRDASFEVSNRREYWIVGKKHLKYVLYN